ncbi:hypothetical protein AAZX31_16G142500 [Glycine max]
MINHRLRFCHAIFLTKSGIFPFGARANPSSTKIYLRVHLSQQIFF